MNKTELKEKWGAYCDTDKLVDDTMNLLTKYRHNNTENGVCTMLDVYFTNKQKLIDMFKASSNYVGDMRVILDVEVDRELCGDDIYTFCINFMSKVGAQSIMLSDKDKDGKTLADYTLTGFTSIKASDLLDGDVKNALDARIERRNAFRHDGYTYESYDNYRKVNNAVCEFGYYCSSALNGDMVDYLTRNGIKGTYTVGMKTSRAFNRMCTQYKINTLAEYQRLYARYSDMVAGGKRKMKFFISLNPLDYLTMSFGNSWASCHTIDRSNVRNMPNSYHGMYCGGTISYMLDSTSIITYVHNEMPEGVETGKIYRNMFHYGNGTLIQGRIYPQGKDGATDLYQTFRSIMQKEMSKMLGKEDEWIDFGFDCDERTSTCGVHYPDYLHFEDCNVSHHKDIEGANNNVVCIGNERICPNCGEIVSDDDGSKRLGHYNCD